MSTTAAISSPPPLSKTNPSSPDLQSYVLQREELLKIKVPILDKKIFQILSNNNADDDFHQSTPPQVEFELRHAYEHLEKLKFNWLELRTKREFLENLVEKGREDQSSQQPFSSRWCPAELKQLEDEILPIKMILKEEKSKTTSLIEEIELSSIDVVSLEEKLSLQYDESLSLLNDIIQCENEIQNTLDSLSREDSSTTHPPSSTSPQELDFCLQELLLESSSVSDCIQRQNESISDLQRLISLIDEEIDTTQDQLDDFRKINCNNDNTHTDKNENLIHSLCDWYQGMLDFMSKLTFIKGIEMIRPDYLLLTTSTGSPRSSPTGPERIIHLHLHPTNASLLDVRLNYMTLNDESIIKEAIERNNIPFLLRNLV